MWIFFLFYIGTLWSTLIQSSSINFSCLIVLYSSRPHISQNKQLWLNEFTHLSSLLWLSAVCTHYYIGCMNILLLHTFSFVWFLSGLEWILNLEFCLLKLLISYQKLSWNIRSRLNSSTFWVFKPVFTYVWSKSSFFVHKASILIKHSGIKTQNMEELSLDLIFHNNFW